MNADEKVQQWAQMHFKEELHGGGCGTERGEINAHYRWCDKVTVKVIDQYESWYSTLTYEGWIVQAQVHCPCGEVANSNGPFKLNPITIRLSGYDLSEIIREMDTMEGG